MVAVDAPVKQLKEDSVKMIEVLRTNDPVLLSYITAALHEAGIRVFPADDNMSILDGSIVAIPRRLMVAPSDGDAAKALVADAIANPPGLAEDQDDAP